MFLRYLGRPISLHPLLAGIGNAFNSVSWTWSTALERLHWGWKIKILKWRGRNLSIFAPSMCNHPNSPCHLHFCWQRNCCLDYVPWKSIFPVQETWQCLALVRYTNLRTLPLEFGVSRLFYPISFKHLKHLKWLLGWFRGEEEHRVGFRWISVGTM